MQVGNDRTLIRATPARPGDHVQVPAGARKRDGTDLRERGNERGQWFKLTRPDMLIAAAACHKLGHDDVAARIQVQV